MWQVRQNEICASFHGIAREYDGIISGVQISRSNTFIVAQSLFEAVTAIVVDLVYLRPRRYEEDLIVAVMR